MLKVIFKKYKDIILKTFSYFERHRVCLPITALSSRVIYIYIYIYIYIERERERERSSAHRCFERSLFETRVPKLRLCLSLK